MDLAGTALKHDTILDSIEEESQNNYSNQSNAASSGSDTFSFDSQQMINA